MTDTSWCFNLAEIKHSMKGMDILCQSKLPRMNGQCKEYNMPNKRC